MKLLALGLLATVLLTGCESPHSTGAGVAGHRGWLMGKLTSSDGQILDFMIQKKRVYNGSASGGVYATNAVTGQSFDGQYTGIMQGGISQSWGTASAWGTGGSATATGETWGRWQSTTANTRAFLSDGKGTIINLRMEIQSGFVPHGFGGGRDNHGKEYEVPF